MATKSAQNFCESLPWDIKLQWFDRSGIYLMDADRRVKITLSERGHMQHYVGFNVQLISKTSGKIDEKFFNFNEYLPGTTGLVSYIAWDWNAVPKHPEKFTKAIEAYIKLWE